MVTTPTEFKPDFVSPPGDTIQDMIDEQSMSQAELAERMGRPAKTINEIIKGKAAITPETSLQLERVLGAPSSFWLIREQKYRERLARARESKELKRDVKWMKETFPIKQMCDLGWIEGYSKRQDRQVDLLRNLLGFFGTASRVQWNSVWMASTRSSAFRKSLKFESDPGAIAAWLRKGELDAIRIACDNFEMSRFKEALKEIRLLTTTDPEEFVPRTTELCARSGVAFVLTPQVKGARVSGATRWLDAEKSLIQLSLRYKTDDQFWFTFFHEAAHLVLHRKRDVFLEGIDDPEQRRHEEEADRFAANILIPKDKYQDYVDSSSLTERSIRRFAEDIGVTPGIVVGRLQHDGHVPYSDQNGLKRSLSWA